MPLCLFGIWTHQELHNPSYKKLGTFRVVRLFVCIRLCLFVKGHLCLCSFVFVRVLFEQTRSNCLITNTVSHSQIPDTNVTWNGIQFCLIKLHTLKSKAIHLLSLLHRRITRLLFFKKEGK